MTKRNVTVVFYVDACWRHRDEEFNFDSNYIAKYMTWKCEECKPTTWVVEPCGIPLEYSRS